MEYVHSEAKPRCRWRLVWWQNIILGKKAQIHWIRWMMPFQRIDPCKKVDLYMRYRYFSSLKSKCDLFYFVAMLGNGAWVFCATSLMKQWWSLVSHPSIAFFHLTASYLDQKTYTCSLLTTVYFLLCNLFHQWSGQYWLLFKYWEVMGLSFSHFCF